MWPFTSKRKRILQAFEKACSRLPKFTVWESLVRPNPSFKDAVGGTFTVMQHWDNTVIFKYHLDGALTVYTVGVGEGLAYVTAALSQGDAGRRFSNFDELRFIEKMTGLLNTYTAA